MIPLSRIFLLAIVFYLLYRFVFNFLIPVFRTTKQVRSQFREMQEQMRQNGGGPFQQTGGSPSPNHSSGASSGNDSLGEYIDFEEIKKK